MFFIIEIDRIYGGFGIDWQENVKGVRLGYVAIHLITIPFVKFAEMMKNGSAEVVNEQASR